MSTPTDLTTRCMLVSLNISCWTASRQDKKITEEVALKYAASSSKKVGHYLKQLLPVDKPSYDAVHSAAGYARTGVFYAQTLPWTDTGSRILTAANFLPFSTEIKQAEDNFLKAAGAFLADWPRLVGQARSEMNGLFRAEDYPSTPDLRGKFSFRVSILPLPDSSDFRVHLGKDAVQAIKVNMEADIKGALQRSAKDAWERLRDGLLKMQEKLSQGDAVYRDSLFTNMEELCEVLPRLNLFNDPNLDSAVKAVREKVLMYRPQQCRTMPQHRKSAAAEVDRILDIMKGF